MLETLWYMLILAMQIVQANPQLKSDHLQIEVYIASKPAYSFMVQGNAVQGQFVDAQTRSIFGEFESTRRVPQAYVIFPRQALPEEFEAAVKSSSDQGKSANASTKDKNNSKNTAQPKELVPLTIDFTKALKQLVSFRVKPRQAIEFAEKEKFMGGGKDATTKASATPPSAPNPASATGKPDSATASPSAKADADQKNMINIRQLSNRLEISADFAQMLIIINFI